MYQCEKAVNRFNNITRPTSAMDARLCSHSNAFGPFLNYTWLMWPQTGAVEIPGISV